jgi:hypothetical protein
VSPPLSEQMLCHRRVRAGRRRLPGSPPCRARHRVAMFGSGMLAASLARPGPLARRKVRARPTRPRAAASLPSRRRWPSRRLA